MALLLQNRELGLRQRRFTQDLAQNPQGLNQMLSLRLHQELGFASTTDGAE